MQSFSRVSEAVDHLFKQFPGPLRIATPLGLGKPNVLLNEIYQRVKRDPSRSLNLFTALSLEVPSAKSDLEKRFLNPFLSRHFGEDYPNLDYIADRKKNLVPDHIQIQEFYMQASQNLRVRSAQEDYISLNYTHVASSLVRSGLQVVVQLVAKKEIEGKTRYSLSCNPDLTLDVRDLLHQAGKKLFFVAVVHPDLPFMGDDAEVDEDFFDILIDGPEHHHQLFAPPRTAVEPADHWIGIHASQLVEDDGTLQIGIGSLSDAVVHSMLLRHQKNDVYRALISFMAKNSTGDGPRNPLPIVHHNAFHLGLYGTSEMVMDGFMHLRRAGILKRRIFDLDEEKRRYLHGAFFLGSKEFYQWLRDLSPLDRAGFGMTRVSKVNDLYDANEMALRRQRQKARFFNTCMNVTLLGGAGSETLPNGQVISGVGGQYNFVAMAHELPDARSVLLLRSTHAEGKKRVSNIVWSHGHLTIPRHLRDLVVTEYGIADLRGRSDEECIKALIEIADANFQEELVATAKKNGKLRDSYAIPAHARRNTAADLQKTLKASGAERFFPAFPFGSDFTPAEENLVLALLRLKKGLAQPTSLLRLLWRGRKESLSAWSAELERMNYVTVTGIKDRILRRLLMGALAVK